MSIEGAPSTVVQLGGVAVTPSRPQARESQGAGSLADPAEADASAALRHLLHIESEMRECRSVEELGVLLVNELRRMIGARAAYFVDLGSGKPRLTQVSGGSEIDRNAPTTRWLERELKASLPTSGWRKASPLTLRVGANAQDEEGRTFPFPYGHWLPLTYRDTRPANGVAVVGDEPFGEGPIAIGERLAGTAAHASRILRYRAPRQKMRPRYRVLLYALLVAAVTALFYPVPMTALAPMEVVPKDPFVVAAPIDGVIDTIVASPNSMVKAGDLVVQYVDTVPRNQLQVAEQEVSVAMAKLRQLQQSSFVDESAKRELAQAKAELNLKIAERDYARDTFDKSRIHAMRDGLVIYADRKEWVGKPVVTGQRILEIADESKVELRANLPVAEVLNLQPGARARAFLNGDPLRPVDARITSVSHQARVVEGQGLVYLVTAQFDTDQRVPRPGVRGTAQLFSDKAPLGYYLFRRPLTWLRQKVGL